MTRHLAVLLLAACALVAGCGGGSDETAAPPAVPKPSAAEQTRLTQMRSKCVAALKAGAEVSASDDKRDARLGLIDCIAVQNGTAYPSTKTGSLAQLRPRLEGVCADNAARMARARTLGGNAQTISAAGAERLARLIRRMPTPTDRGAEFGGWRDALTTVARLSASPQPAYRAQGVRTAAASRQTAAKLGLAKCARP